MGIADNLKQQLGLSNATIKYGLSKQELFHAAIANDRGRVKVGGPDDAQKAFATKLGVDGPLIFYTDPSCTGRPVQDTFAVAWPEIEDKVWWKNDFKKFDPAQIDGLFNRAIEHLNAKAATLYVKDQYSGWIPSYAIPLRFVGEFATHAMFIENMFVDDVPGVENEDDKRWTILNVPSFRCDPARDGTASDRAVILDFRNRRVLVLGRADYCGINKKAMFTVMNFLLPERNEMPMHSSANIGKDGHSAILFGLSGTGKTTLSADPDRLLIGDDEHAWTDEGVSNFEGGCYAKLIDLNKEAEPVIAAALSMAGTLIENVPALPSKPLSETDPQELDLCDDSITENTRFSYPLSCNPGVAEGARGPHPNTLVFLTADAFGVLPPVSILDENEVIYHFVSGFTAKLAGTEVGITEPKAAFSACFGAPFMAHKPSVYARLLAEKVKQSKTRCILLNTGWTGGGYGEGKRISIKATRAMLNAALAGELHGEGVEYDLHPIFGLKMPRACPGVDAELLNPKNGWADKALYDEKAKELKAMFQKNFETKGFAELGIKPAM